LPEEAIEELPPSALSVFTPATGKASGDIEVEFEEAPTGDSGLKLVWLRNIVGTTDYEDEEEEEEEEEFQPIVDRKVLTIEERERLKPVAEFIMIWTKAMLRTGYYSPEHPHGAQAKEGLFGEFKRAVANDRELTINIQESLDQYEITVIGILDEPVSAKTVIGPGQAELFVPKIKEYFNKKGLLSLSIRADITHAHFESFVDVMSDPAADTGERDEIGALLTQGLVRHGITEISALFMDDIFLIDRKLPWRVQMAISRLAKDLKMVPMFDTASDEDIRLIKFQSIHDVLRPLRRAQYLKDIVVNAYLIAKRVKDTEEKELQDMIVQALPLPMLLPSSKMIKEDLVAIREQEEYQQGRDELIERHDAIKLNLLFITRRLVKENVSGSMKFIEGLFFDDVVPFEELPPYIQYRINTIRLAEDLRARPEDYQLGLMQVTDPADIMVFLRCFRRVAPLLIEQEAFADLAMIVELIKRGQSENPVFQAGIGDIPAVPIEYVFMPRLQDLAVAYDSAEKANRQEMALMLHGLANIGVTILGVVLEQSEKLGVRKGAIEDVVKMKEFSLPWVRSVVDNPTRPWFLQRNSLLILSQIGDQEDIRRARRFVKHSHPRLREEALHTLLKLEGHAVEPLLVEALDDHDRKVQRRAIGCMAQLQPLSEQCMRDILGLIAQPRPKDKDQAAVQDMKVAKLVRAVGTMTEMSLHDETEGVLLTLANQRIGKKGVLARLRKQEDKGGKALATAIIDTLGKVGSANAIPFLQKTAADQDSELAPNAKKAWENIQQRHTL